MLAWYQLIPLAFIAFLIWDQWDKSKRRVRGPPPIPILGNTPIGLYFGVEKRFQMWQWIIANWGNTVLFRGTWTNVTITTNPDNIKYITSTNFDNYKRQDRRNQNKFNFKVVHSLFGEGIFMADDQVWDIQRKVATPLFKKHSLDSMKAVFTKKADLVLDLISTKTKETASFDIQKIFHEYTLDSFSVIGFGMDVDSLHHDLKFPFHFDRAQRQMMTLFSNPFLQWFGENRNEFFESTSFIQDYFNNAIDNHKGGGDDLLSVFLSLKDSDGKPYPKKWIIDILVNFAIAGRDTTALLLTWTVYAVCSNPRVEAEVVAEIDRILGNEVPNTETIAKMPYLANVLSETLRLYPSVPFTGRFAENDDTLPDGTKVYAGERVAYFQLFLHRDPTLWEKAEEYIPERWDDKEKTTKHAMQYTPFHAGPMQCLGRHMALIEAKILLAKLFQKFKITLDPNHEVGLFVGTVMPATKGIKVTVKHR